MPPRAVAPEPACADCGHVASEHPSGRGCNHVNVRSYDVPGGSKMLHCTCSGFATIGGRS
jgi:hypothetical protein